MKSKIFITTGSVLEFDCLIKIIDKINKNKKYNIVAQIGKGIYKPKNITTFTFTKNIKKYYDWADLIITHTGGTTLSEICLNKKKSIAISNPKGYRDIYEIAEHFDKLGYLLYIPFEKIEKNPKLLESKIDLILSSKIKFKKYIKENNTIGKEILKYLNIKAD
ncbi:MAG TPA: glycosyltransferase [Candidatus Diapherotrites archaeon]|nr:glycosyltransferase [Candidatus Diapherotrites archaeon]